MEFREEAKTFPSATWERGNPHGCGRSGRGNRLRVGNGRFAYLAPGRLGDVFLIGVKDAALDGANYVMRIVVALNGELHARAWFAMQGEADFFLRQGGGVILVDPDDDIARAEAKIRRRAATGQRDDPGKTGDFVEFQAHPDTSEALVFLRHEGLEGCGLGGQIGRCRLSERHGGKKTGEAGGKEQFHGMLSFLDLSNRDAGSIPDFGKNEQKNLQESIFDGFWVRF
jgi:hypothetical protein